MPTHKTLKSIAHNFGHSLISLNNYYDNDYFLGHLLRNARKSSRNRLVVDILNINYLLTHVTQFIKTLSNPINLSKK